MKRLITFVAIIFSVAAFGQDALKSKTPTEIKQLLFGINISPDYCNRTLKNNNGSHSSSMIIDLLKKIQESKIGYSAGLNICYNISKKLGVELGIQYSNKGFAFKKSDLIFSDMIDPRFGYVYSMWGSAEPAKAKFIYNHIYLDVPVRAIFSLGEKRIHFVTSIGFTTNLFIKATQTSVFEFENGNTKRETHEQQYNFKSFDISPTISVGLDYTISNKINLQAEPTLRYGVLKIIEAPITGYLWNIGLNITCYYTLK